ncbi:hypothetical protein, conserved [Trypanosoma vivax Y486]|uniref:Leucine-rich repeat protein (LRRP) n=1 Tax=Trypanosoma vivax (strain Y486) TaxID=1055687 RepID=F9WMJ4_TRYVY|nr:hypothetical protein, conserved [Trypanosoma vivax Y486]|eukprot:CCD18751.1 hypothetical protein, conserved [Trypanosoma vivax Y486]
MKRERYDCISTELRRNVRDVSILEQKLSSADLEPLRGCTAVDSLKFLKCRGVMNVEALSTVHSLRDLHVDLEGELHNLPALQNLPYLKRLFIDNENLHDCDVLPLCDMSSLEEVALHNASAIVHIGKFGRMPCLRVLTLHRVGVTDDFLCSLTTSGSLTHLNLTECSRLTDVEPLASIKTLEQVNLSGSFPGVRGLAALGSLPRLRELNLKHTAVTDDCLKTLSASKTLVRLFLVDCRRLTDVTPLVKISSLQVVDLSDCSGITKGMGGFGTLSGLYALSLTGTALTDEQLQELCASQSLESLSIKRCKLLTDVGVLGFVTTLRELDMSECDGVARGFCSFSALRELRSLYMTFTCVTNECLCEISKCPQLVKLSVAGCKKLTDISCLSQVHTLEDLNVNMCEHIEDGLGVLGGLEELRTLRMSFTAVGNDELRLVCKSKTLERSELEGCERITDVSALAVAQSLMFLNLDRCQKVVTGVGELGKLPALRVVSLQGVSVTEDDMKSLKMYNKRLFIQQ